ncbi:hypothetical protein [Amycolatopsis rubida]|uniref:hypothetical protein n=1 Tax=Amycolatopsis rubida TaxID=112413 RepID=UPI00142F3574|nr:hypothetical protein [Amycolatopsis rubida]
MNGLLFAPQILLRAPGNPPADGQWRVVEIVDGQVSDRPDAIAPDTMIQRHQDGAP